MTSVHTFDTDTDGTHMDAKRALMILRDAAALLLNLTEELESSKALVRFRKKA